MSQTGISSRSLILQQFFSSMTLAGIQNAIFYHEMDEIHGSPHLAENCVSVLSGRAAFWMSKASLEKTQLAVYSFRSFLFKKKRTFKCVFVYVGKLCEPIWNQGWKKMKITKRTLRKTESKRFAKNKKYNCF